MIDTLCLFTQHGRTFTFKNVEILTDNETGLVFTYQAMSDGRKKKMTAFKPNLVGVSVTE